jgi:hypothetical protein
VCQEPGCNALPNFGYATANGSCKAIRCSAHKVEGMINVATTKCEPHNSMPVNSLTLGFRRKRGRDDSDDCDLDDDQVLHSSFNSAYARTNDLYEEQDEQVSLLMRHGVRMVVPSVTGFIPTNSRLGVQGFVFGG